MSHKTPFRDFKRAHWPMLAAIEAGDMNHYAALVERNLERAEIARRSPSCCIFCHSLQVVTDTGFAFCPYRDPGNHARAREFNLGGERDEVLGVISVVPARSREPVGGVSRRLRREVASMAARAAGAR